MNPEELKAYRHEHYRQRRTYLLQHHRCVRCKKQDSRTLQGYTQCEDCSYLAKVYYMKRRSKT